MAQLSSPKAQALALAMTGLAAVASFPTAAQAFTQKQCTMIEAAFGDHIAVNAKHYSNEDKAELRKFNTWLTNGGCLNNARLELVRRPEVGAVMTVLQGVVNRSPDPSLRVNLSPTISFVPVETAAIRPASVPQSGSALSAPVVQTGVPRVN